VYDDERIYREKVDLNKSSFIQHAVDIFGMNQRNSQFFDTEL